MSATARKSPILDSTGDPFVVSAASRDGGRRYESMPQWMGRVGGDLRGRNWEVGGTDRLNEAHWFDDSEKTINKWLEASLAKVRARATYETRQNGTLSGMVTTLCDTVVGRDGPVLQVQSESSGFNEALEAVWKDWFKAPTFRPNMSGAALLKLWVRNLPRCGEFLARIATDKNASGPVKMRLRPTHVRRLVSPVDQTNRRIVLGVEFDPDGEYPVRYWITQTSPDGYTETSEPWPPDLVIHEFIVDEENQARGFPWFTPSLQTAADLRDYDDQVQDAARLMADHSALLYTENSDEPWPTPESTTFERRTIKTAPPGWKPYDLPASQPPAQYPDYRDVKLGEIGRPMNMPLMIVRLDSKKHNYSSARFDGQGWGLFAGGIQTWLSGSEQSYGTLNRLVDEVAAEARFSVSELGHRPENVVYIWTWPPRPHVDPFKERMAVDVGLGNRSLSLTDALALEGRTLETHVATLQREATAFEAAGLPLPAYMTDQTADDGERPDPEKDDATEDAKADSNG